MRVYIGGAPSIDRWITERQAVLGDGATGFWRLNDAVGSMSAADEVSGGATGTASNITYGASGPSGAESTKSATFNGTSSQISVPSSSVPDGTGDLTVEAWVKPSVTNTYQMIVTKDTSNGATVDPYELRLDTSAHLQFLEGTGSACTVATSGGTVAAGAWHLVTATKSSDGRISLYIDGRLDSTTSFPTTVATNSLPVLIGARNDGTGPFKGQMADVALSPVALSDVQILQQYNSELATLSGAAPVTFSALTQVPVSGSLPAAPQSEPQTIRVDYRNPSSAANISITATNTSTGSVFHFSGSVADPRLGLATYNVTDDNGGVASGSAVTATQFTGGGLDPSYGLETDSIVDPGASSSGHLDLDTRTAYETPGTGYLRRLSSALPSADITQSTQSSTTTYYGDAETRDVPCASGPTGVNQGGLVRFTTGPTNSLGGALAVESVYTSGGLVAATRNTADGANWTCSYYDSRGRITQESIPALGTASARTINYNYAVGGNPLVSSISDAAGTETTAVDLLDRTISYTDTTGTTTTTTYDQAGRTTAKSTTTTGGGPSSTVSTSYLDDGRISSVSLDGKTIAVPSYDTNAELTGVTYPNSSGNGGNGSSLGSIDIDPQHRTTSATWTLADGNTLTDTRTISQASRTTSDTVSLNGQTQSAWTYGYDNAGRVTSAMLATAASGPQVTLSYGYANSGGCGADAAAGADSVRTSSSVAIGSGPAQQAISCADYASRLTSATGANPLATSDIGYDTHGNLIQLKNESFTYDSSDRMVGTSITSSGGTETLSYTRDVSGRVVQRNASGSGTGAESDTTAYGYADATDSPVIQLTASKQIAERYMVLPGGVLLTHRYAAPGGDIWSYPNLHGDVVMQANSAGTMTASNFTYDPFGQPISRSTGSVSPANVPRTRTAGPTDAWEGQNQRGYENAEGISFSLMGARVYLPAWGQFTAVDPVAGGNSNPYTYPLDPINSTDLTGDCVKGFGFICKHVKAVAIIATSVVVVAGTIAVGCVVTACTADGPAVAAEIGETVALADGETDAAAASVAGEDASETAAQAEVKASLEREEEETEIARQNAAEQFNHALETANQVLAQPDQSAYVNVVGTASNFFMPATEIAALGGDDIITTIAIVFRLVWEAFPFL